MQLRAFTSIYFNSRELHPQADGEEIEGNLQQLLRAWGDDDIIVKDWLQQNKYMSHDIVNEQISIIGLSVLCSLLSSIKECSPLLYAIIGDEATNVVNREQLNVSIRWVNNDYEVNEDPVGLFAVPNLIPCVQ